MVLFILCLRVSDQGKFECCLGDEFQDYFFHKLHGSVYLMPLGFMFQNKGNLSVSWAWEMNLKIGLWHTVDNPTFSSINSGRSIKLSIYHPVPTHTPVAVAKGIRTHQHLQHGAGAAVILVLRIGEGGLAGGRRRSIVFWAMKGARVVRVAALLTVEPHMSGRKKKQKLSHVYACMYVYSNM